MFALEETHDVELEWLPYTLRIAEYLDSVDTRTPHNWRKVRYAYMDARRYANEQGLTLKGPKRIYDATYASAGMLFAQRNGFFLAPTTTPCSRCSGPTNSTWTSWTRWSRWSSGLGAAMLRLMFEAYGERAGAGGGR